MPIQDLECEKKKRLTSAEMETAVREPQEVSVLAFWDLGLCMLSHPRDENWRVRELMTIHLWRNDANEINRRRSGAKTSRRG